MDETIPTSNGETIIVRTEIDGSISLVVGRSGMYVLASLTLDEAAAVREALAEAIATFGSRGGVH